MTRGVLGTAGLVAAWVGSVLGAGCDTSLAELDAIYSRPGDGPITCGISVDNKNTVSNDAIAVGLDKAQAEELVVHLYSHKPAGTVDESTIEQVIASAADRDLPFVTYRELLEPTGAHGLALSFDDHDIVGWHGLLPLFERYRARVTFFISAFEGLSAGDRALLHELAAAGHDIEYHSTWHEDAEDYAAAAGVEQYVLDDIRPGLAAMRADGFDPQVFAYPFGARTAATDAAVLAELPLVRGSYFNCPR